MIKQQRVKVYYNLHKKCLSVMDKKTRLIIDHVNSIQLDNVKFTVSAAGLKRLRRRKRKSVIAFIEGDYVSKNMEKIMHCPTWRCVYFNPYMVDQFMIGDVPIYEADQVYIIDKHIYSKQKTI